MRALLVLGFVVLASCTRSSGVWQVGPDTYTIMTAAGTLAGGVPEARKIALIQANEYCDQHGTEILVISVSKDTVTNAEITFRCLAKGDPGLQHP
jgi:hypothetical protein